MNGLLVLVRHGESEWNALGKWTGWTDVELTQKGREEARRAAEPMKDIAFDQAFCSDLTRAKQTLNEILKVLGREDLPVTYDPALKERDYGDYTGKNKWEVQKEVGDEQFQAIRRGYETPIPNGENLKQVCERVHPYFDKNILPILRDGKTVLVAAHGNSLRALIKLLDNVPDDQAASIEMKTGEVVKYVIDREGRVVSKEMVAKNEDVGLQ